MADGTDGEMSSRAALPQCPEPGSCRAAQTGGSFSCRDGTLFRWAKTPQNVTLGVSKWCRQAVSNVTTTLMLHHGLSMVFFSVFAWQFPGTLRIGGGIGRGQSHVLDESAIWREGMPGKERWRYFEVSTMTKATLANRQGRVAAERNLGAQMPAAAIQQGRAVRLKSLTKIHGTKPRRADLGQPSAKFLEVELK